MSPPQPSVSGWAELHDLPEGSIILSTPPGLRAEVWQKWGPYGAWRTIHTDYPDQHTYDSVALWGRIPHPLTVIWVAPRQT